MIQLPRLRTRYCHSLVIISLLSSGSFLSIAPALADSPTPGTAIENQATGSFIDDSDSSTQTVESDKVTLTVAEVAGINVSAKGISGTPNPGTTVYFSFLITNVGNDPTQFYLPNLANLTGNATQGNLQITGYNLDGTTPVTLTTPITVTTGGQTGSNGAGNAGLLGSNGGGIFLPGGSVTVRVPVTINSNAANNDAITVQLGDTPEDSASTTTPKARLQNQTYAAGSNDVYTVDNPNSLETSANAPLNGTTEASAASSTTVIKLTISGTVFEDINYGGGAGRSQLSASGIGRPNVRVELYNATTGDFVAATNTDNNGFYEFSSGITNGMTYSVRVVNSTVTSSRTLNSGFTTANTSAVQTYRFDPDASTTAIVNEVGGANPTLVDSGANTTNANLSTLTTTTQTAQSVSTFTLSTNDTAGVDFGFNFNTIVSTNDSGQGSLRQFINNSNALANTSLNQVGQIPDYETSIFMIPNGVANPGQNTSYSNQLTSGVAVINLASDLPTITDTKTRLNGGTQTTNVRTTPSGAETNPGQLGTGGTVGVEKIPLPLFNRPEVEIKGTYTLTATGTFSEIKNMAFNAHRILVSGANSLVEDNLVGMQADGTTNATTAGVGGHGLEAGADSDITIKHNYVRVNESGIRRNTNGSRLTIEFNEVDLPSSGHTTTYDGILIIGSGSNDIVRNNLAKNMRGGGIELGFQGGTLTNTLIENNTVYRNGYNSAGSSTASTEGMGIVAYSAPSSTITLTKNIINENSGPGIVVMSSTGIKITQNSTFDNVGLGIDLDANTRDPNSYGTPNGVTLNDLNDADTGPNNLLNFPVFTSALTDGNNLIVAGYARPSNAIELFIPDSNSGFGEGKTYLTTVTEGVTTGTKDRDGKTGSYSGTIFGVTPGTDTTNQFRFVIPLTSGKLNGETISVGTNLTATATEGNNTSEFSGIVTVAAKTKGLDLVKRITKINNSITNNNRSTAPINLDVYENGTGTEDDDSNWTMAGGSSYLKGKINGGEVKATDTIEYTIYFRNAGNTPLKTVQICDLIPQNTTYQTGSIKLKIGNSSEIQIGDPTGDNDKGEFLPANQSLNGLCRPDRNTAQIVASTDNKGGAVWLEVDRGSNPLEPNDYGYLKFSVKVN
jgi:trimeric autotransporter adhesin